MSINVMSNRNFFPGSPLNLRKEKYDIETLEKNIHTICVKTCVNTQILTAEFCVKYVLNEDYMSCIEDTYCLDIGYHIYEITSSGLGHHNRLFTDIIMDHLLPSFYKVIKS